jgi:hypothetical protein
VLAESLIVPWRLVFGRRNRPAGSPRERQPAAR